MNIQELKGQAYDCLRLVEAYQQKLRQLNSEIAKLEAAGKPTEAKKK